MFGDAVAAGVYYVRQKVWILLYPDTFETRGWTDSHERTYRNCRDESEKHEPRRCKVAAHRKAASDRSLQIAPISLLEFTICSNIHEQMKYDPLLFYEF